MKKILFIEDDISLSAAYRAKLFRDYQTRGAITGDEGIKIALDWHPDFILLDLFLPGGKSGHDVLRELKKNKKTKDMPVMVLTNLENECPKVIKNGAIECYIKTDTSMEGITQKIKEYLQK